MTTLEIEIALPSGSESFPRTFMSIAVLMLVVAESLLATGALLTAFTTILTVAAPDSSDPSVIAHPTSHKQNWKYCLKLDLDLPRLG